MEKFKIKLIKRDLPGLGQTSFKIKVGEENQGLYKQLTQNSKQVGYNTGKFSLDDMKQAIGGIFVKDPTRSVKIHTTQAGLDLFNKALAKQVLKNTKNEYRKRFSFKSKIFKQTYKFGQ